MFSFHGGSYAHRINAAVRAGGKPTFCGGYEPGHGGPIFKRNHSSPEFLGDAAAILSRWRPAGSGGPGRGPAGDDPKSTVRRVRNWEQGKNAPTSREDLFRIAFAMELDEEQTSGLLGLCTDYGIHYRNGRELTYAYCLRRGLNYEQASDLYASLPDPSRSNRSMPGKGPFSDTQQIVSAFSSVHDDQEFIRLYEEYLDSFGTLHQRAWDYFDRFFQVLATPDRDEERYSIEKAAQTYLSLHMPSGSRRREFTLIQRMIKQGWPNATKLKNICARREDVPRKLLLLLYLITENVLDDAYDELDESYLSSEELFEEHWWRVNLMLRDCGMPTLDPRNAYDWLVLYSLNSGAGQDEAMAERMEAVITALFPADKEGENTSTAEQ